MFRTRIRIVSSFNQVSGSESEFEIRIQKGKIDPQNKQKNKKFHDLKLDILFWGLTASPVAWTFFMEAHL